MSTGSAAFATTHGVIDRVHNHAAVARTTAEPARAAGLTGAFERVFAIAHDADGCSAGGKDFASFARRKFDNSIVALARHYLCEGAGAASDECALAGTELDVVYQRTYRYLTQRQAVAYFGSHVFAGNHGGADFEAVGRDDVRFGTVDVIQQGNACRAVGVVLDALDYGGYAVFVSLKVYDTVLAFVATAQVSGGEVAFGVASAAGALTDCKRFLRCSSSDGTFEYTDNFVSLPGGGGLEFSYCHFMLDVAKEVYGLTVGDVYKGFLPLGCLAAKKAGASPARFVLAADYGCVDVDDFYTVSLLYEGLNLVFVCLGGYAEGVCPVLFGKLGGLLGNDGFNHYIHCCSSLEFVYRLERAFGNDDYVVVEQCVGVGIAGAEDIDSGNVACRQRHIAVDVRIEH